MLTVALLACWLFLFFFNASLSPEYIGNFAAFTCTFLQGFSRLNALRSTLLFSPALSIYSPQCSTQAEQCVNAYVRAANRM